MSLLVNAKVNHSPRRPDDAKALVSVLPLFVHIKSDRESLSAEHVYDIHCITYGSRPPSLITWWLGTIQLLDHSSQVRHLLFLKDVKAGNNAYDPTLLFSW